MLYYCVSRIRPRSGVSSRLGGWLVPLALTQLSGFLVNMLVPYFLVSRRVLSTYVHACRILTQSFASSRIATSRWAFTGGKRMSFRCGRCRRPHLRGKPRHSVALPVAALPGLTRRPGCRSFGSCGRIGWRACGGEPSAGFLPGGLVAFPVTSGHAFGHSPNPALQATGRIKPRPAPELSRWAFTGEGA